MGRGCISAGRVRAIHTERLGRRGSRGPGRRPQDRWKKSRLHLRPGFRRRRPPPQHTHQGKGVISAPPAGTLPGSGFDLVILTAICHRVKESVQSGSFQNEGAFLLEEPMPVFQPFSRKARSTSTAPGPVPLAPYAPDSSDKAGFSRLPSAPSPPGSRSYCQGSE